MKTRSDRVERSAPAFAARIAEVFNGPARSGGKPWFTIKNQDAGPVEILIYDQIGKDWWTGEGTEAKAFVEALAKIPKSQEIVLRINSPGGNVHDGMAIYNQLAERRDKVTVKVDGEAASIASVVALAGRSLEMPKNSWLMVHDPWGIVQGNAEDLRRAAVMLDKHRDGIIAVYADKTKSSKADIEKWMKEETWFTGEDAKVAGFADKVTGEITIQACFDHSRFEKTPKQLVENKTAGQENNIMRDKIIAKLKNLGIQFADTATDEELEALLTTAAANTNKTKPKAKAKVLVAAGAPDDAEAEDEETDSPSDAASTEVTDRRKPVQVDPTIATMRAVQVDPTITAMRADLNRVQAHLDKERKGRIEGVVDQCIAEDRLPGAQRDKWVARALADESVLDDLRAMQPRRLGADPVGIVITGEAPMDIQRGILTLRDPLASFLRGNVVNMDVIGANAKQMATEITKHRKKLDVILNANTVDPALKRNVILADMMRAYRRRLVMLNVFATRFVNVPLQGTDKVSMPFFDLDTSATSNFANATGYLFAEDTAVAAREITINKRKYKALTFSSDEFRRQPYFSPPTSLLLKAEQLALDVWLDVLSVVTVANYGVEVLDAEAGTFDVDDVITIRKHCQNADWPDTGRALVLGTEHEAGLLADESLKFFLNANSDQSLRVGATGRLLNFEMFYSPRIPSNSEALAGFAVLPEAVLVATAPIAPAPGVRSILLSYDLVVDPELGIAFEYRFWGEAQMDKDREVVEVNYGYAKGNSAALKRITDGSAQGSSSSSQSSVNSSSSSSSSPSY